MTSTAPRHLIHEWQAREWDGLPVDYRHTLADGTRTVMVLTDQGTALATWYGPTPGQHTITLRSISPANAPSWWRVICTCGWTTDNTTETTAQADADRHAQQHTR